MSIESPSNAETLLVDVYLISQKSNGHGNSVQAVPSTESHLIALANLAVDINEYIQQFPFCSTEPVNADKMAFSSLNRQDRRYPWMSGGDGPVFGIHCSSSCSKNIEQSCDQQNKSSTAVMIPHLRAMCCYGICVNDEWYFLGLVLRFLQNLSAQKFSSYRIAVECFDVDDGQILFIEAAHHLPSWIDDVGPNHCHRRCWVVATTDEKNWNTSFQLIRPRSSHDLIAPTPLLLGDALDLLGGSDCVSHSIVEDAPPLMERAILDRISRSTMDGLQFHRTAVALPRSVAHLFHYRPDLIAVACRMFVENIHCPIKHAVKRREDYVLDQCNDWVWTTLSLSRTAYAMVRTIASKPDWIHEDVIAPQFLMSSLEIKRFQRQCFVEATPHLRYGLQLGIRLLAGLHYCLCTASNPKLSVPSSHDSLTVMERRVLLHWSRIANTCRTNYSVLSRQNQNIDWISESWNVGPNNAKHDVNSMLKCPVFEPEIESCLTPLSFPGIELAEQVRIELLNRKRRNELQPRSAHPPGPFDVDDDRWMWTLSTLKDKLLSEEGAGDEKLPGPQRTGMQTVSDTVSNFTAASKARVFDEVLDSVQTFMTGSSAVEGVDMSSRFAVVHKGTPISSTRFMNILHTALQSKTAEELFNHLHTSRRPLSVNDPFFSKEDYSMLEPSDSDRDEEDYAIDNDPNDLNLNDLMNAMDEELLTSATSRELDDLGLASSHGESHDIAQKTHVLSNLMKSLDTAAGGSGPIRNILEDMGTGIPSENEISADN